MPNQTLNHVRIIGGSLRSRKVSFPDAEGLRPTADRIRETLFNWLQFDLQGRYCLYLFAGSGVLGIEALSRGAAGTTFIEKNPQAANLIANNLKQLELDAGKVQCADALKWLSTIDGDKQKFDIVFIDPPFASNYLAELITVLDTKPIFASNCKLYIESPILFDEIAPLKNWTKLKAKKAGKVYFSLWQFGSSAIEG